ncbi:MULTISPECIES: hypothetical protein [Mycobacteriaceae]|uniref:SMI1/KNR4 family protein n=1 Tax=Mycolicibacterium mucogenicum DSM 44124 TaxID=1226753 RepID=A0A8E4W316_MYCMU|nr:MULTISPECIES: hypothetical protein [Mycobacteriaceae]QPG69139.1 hypothetical protein C1S78_027780 [Mycolicibacterium mucogenicum DSM 44124]
MTLRADYQLFIRERIGGHRIDLLENDDVASGSVPQWWLDANAADGRDAVERALRVWQPVIARRLPRLTEKMTQDGLDVFIARMVSTGAADVSGQRPLLLYVLRNTDNGSVFDTRFGPLPLDRDDRPVYWNGIPSELQSFYLEIHDGFYDDCGGAGLSPSSSFLLPAEFGDPSEFRFRGEGSQPDIRNLVEICRDGAGGGLCLDVSDGLGRAWDWYQGTLTPKGDLWEALDELLGQL